MSFIGNRHIEGISPWSILIEHKPASPEYVGLKQRIKEQDIEIMLELGGRIYFKSENDYNAAILIK